MIVDTSNFERRVRFGTRIAGGGRAHHRASRVGRWEGDAAVQQGAERRRAARRPSGGEVRCSRALPNFAVKFRSVLNCGFFDCFQISPSNFVQMLGCVV